jgi:hypothetical protein
MVVHLVCILIKSTKGIYLVLSNVGDRCIDQAGRTSTDCSDYLGFIGGIRIRLSGTRARRHNEGVVGGTRGGGIGERSANRSGQSHE